MSAALAPMLGPQLVLGLHEHCDRQAQQLGETSHGCFSIRPMRWRGIHATTPERADSIRSEGFRVGRGESGHSASGSPLFGHGVYCSLDDLSAGLWLRPALEQLVCEANLDNVLIYWYSGSRSRPIRTHNALPYGAAQLGTIPPPVQARIDSPPSYITATGLDLAKWAANAWASSLGLAAGEDRYSELLTAFGFDAICVMEDRATVHAGGNQLCVFDPAKVRLA